MRAGLPWERPIWSHRRWWPFSARYLLTDFRVARMSGWASRRLRPSEPAIQELALEDLGEVRQVRTPLDRLRGTSTLVCWPHDLRRPGLTLAGVRRGAALAALIELIAADPAAALDPPAIQAALRWKPGAARSRGLAWAVGAGAVVVAVFGVVIGLDGQSPVATYGPDDPIRPNGTKRDQQDIVMFMEREVMPWAKATLGRIKGGADNVTCGTCHGPSPVDRGWRMPGVGKLPEPHVRLLGWERSGAMDDQMRNAIYGYLAGSDNQAKARYMREFVLPGMARLLKRPAYDFTRSYAANRQQVAFGCYHCHDAQ